MTTQFKGKFLQESGDLLGTYDFFGLDGDSKQIAAQIRCYADAQATSGAVPGRIEFWTANSSGVLTKASTINSSQVATPSGGVAPISTPSGFANWLPASTTAGTDVAFANNSLFLTSLFVPCNFTATGIAFLTGATSNVADKVIVALYDSTGAPLANSTTAASGTAITLSSTVQAVAFTSTYLIKGPGLYFAGVAVNAGTTSFRGVPPGGNAGLWCGSVSWTHGTVAAVTPPSTFTANKGPMVFVY